MASNSEILEAYRRLFMNEAGGLKPDARLVLADLMKFANFFQDPTMSPNARPSDILPLVEGSRSTVRYILRMSGVGDQFLKRLLQGDD